MITFILIMLCIAVIALSYIKFEHSENNRSIFKRVFSKKNLLVIKNIIVKHKKRVLLYSGGFVIMVIFIFANVKIAHLNDTWHTS
ncbi:MAG: hypothetical protein WC459_04020 [Patescibacteria group bacterium]